MKLISKKDIIIPKGTIFKKIDNEKTEYIYDKYSSTEISLNNDTSIWVEILKKHYSYNNNEYFELKED